MNTSILQEAQLGVFLQPSMRLQEVEKEVTDEQPGKKPKMRKITVMEYLYEQELEGEC